MPARPSGRVTRGRTLADIEVAVRNAEERAKSGDWDGADGGRVLVGLYAMCHRLVYGVLPVELERPKIFGAAARAAGAALRKHFLGDVSRAVDFVKWVWTREKGRAEWAAKNNRDRNRMTWQLQFSDSLVTDFRANNRGR